MKKPVISVFDYTGNMVRPWLDAGYECWIVDFQHPRGVTKEGKLLRKVGADVQELYRGHWWLPDEARILFGFPDCTYLTISGNRWQRARGPGCVGRGLLLADAYWRLAIAYAAPYMLENPAVGRLASSWCKPDFTFHPWEFARYLDDPETDNTAKNTGLWVGNDFVIPEKRPAEGPHRTDCHDAPPSEDRADLRSVTPMGFAKAVFEANCNVEHPTGRRNPTPAPVAGGSPSLRKPPLPVPPHLRAGRHCTPA